MEALQAIILGIIQGLAEWLPISSEGINSLVMINFFGTGVGQAITIAIWLHLGTLLSALIYFRKEVSELFRKGFDAIAKPKDFAYASKKNILLSFIVFATIASLVTGGIIYFTALKQLNVAGNIATAIIGIMLVITGIILLKAKSAAKQKAIQLKDSLLVGLLQGLALIPGISRSGITTSALLMRKYDARQALTISFLMSIPAVLISIITIAVFDGFYIGWSSLLAVAFAFVVGLLTISIMMKVAEKVNFGVFCLIVGALSILSAVLL